MDWGIAGKSKRIVIKIYDERVRSMSNSIGTIITGLREDEYKAPERRKTQ